MNNLPASDSSNGGATSNLLHYAVLLWRWWRVIVATTVAVTIVAVVISLLLPKWYRASASVIPPRQQDLFGAMATSSSILKSLAGSKGFGGLGQKQGTYNYLALLKSRTAMEEVVRRFKLAEVYGIADGSMEKTIGELEGNVSFQEQNDEYLTIEVLDRDPKRAADMANAFVDVLNDISARLGTQEARNNRDFIEGRLAETQAALRQAEDSLKRQQESSGMILTPEETAGISSVASLYGLKARKEVELGVLQRTVGVDDPQIRQLRVELDELNRKLSTIPEKGMNAIRLYRDVAIQEKIVEFLYPLYEQAKIDEQKDVPVILVLDKAVPPERRDRPKRTLIVLLTFIGTLTISSLLVLGYELSASSGTFDRIRRVFYREEV